MDRAVDCCGQRTTICVAGGVTALVLGIVAFFLSFSSLEFTELGLDFNGITYNVDSTIYRNGRYRIGLGHSFIKFPGKVQTIQFSEDANSVGPQLRSRTSDGLEVQLEVSFQYQLIAEDLFTLYQKFGEEYEKFYIVKAMDLITQHATQFHAGFFFNNRTIVANNMTDVLKEFFLVEGFCDIPSVQLRAVTLPSRFEQTIRDTEVQRQDIEKASAERANRKVQAETEFLNAQKQAEQIVIAAQATSQSIILQTEAYVEQFKLSQTLQAQSFSKLLTILKQNETSLINYLETRALRDHPSAKTVISIT